MSERIARTLVIAALVAVGAVSIAIELETRISQSFYPG
jgi:hypothetical protein